MKYNEQKLRAKFKEDRNEQSVALNQVYTSYKALMLDAMRFIDIYWNGIVIIQGDLHMSQFRLITRKEAAKYKGMIEAQAELRVRWTKVILRARQFMQSKYIYDNSKHDRDLAPHFMNELRSLLKVIPPELLTYIYSGQLGDSNDIS